MSTRKRTTETDIKKGDKLKALAIVSAFINMQTLAPKAWGVLVAFIQGLVYDVMRAAFTEVGIYAENRYTVGNITYIQVTGPVAYIVRAIQGLKDRTAVIVLGLDKYADRAVMVYHTGADNARLAMPEDLLNRIFLGGNYVPITKIGAVNSTRFIALGGQWLGTERVQNALFQIAREMFNKDGAIIGAKTDGTKENTFLAPVSATGSTTEFATFTIYGPDTSKSATIGDIIFAAAYVNGGFLFRTDRKTGDTFVSTVNQFVDAKGLIWHRLGTFSAKITDIAAIKQTDGSIVLVGTAESGNYLLIPMKIENRDDAFFGTVEDDLRVARDTTPYGVFTGLTAGGDNAIFQGANVTTTVDISTVAGLNEILNPSARPAVSA